MNTTIIAAMIPAIVTIFVTIINIIANKTGLFYPYKKEFLEQQISELLAPMDKIMTFYTAGDWEKIRIEFKSLIEDKYILAPSLIVSTFHPLLLQDKITNEQFMELKSIVSSIYNWTRKAAGYTYDDSKIRRKFSNNKRDVHIESCLILFILAIFYLCLIVAAAFFIKIHDSIQSLYLYLDWIVFYSSIGIAIVCAVFEIKWLKRP